MKRRRMRWYALLPAALLLSAGPVAGQDSGADALTPADSATARHFAERYRIGKDLAHTIVRAARTEGIEPGIAFGLVRVESVFRPRAVGSGGALGLTQILLGTARSLQPGITREQVLEPETNLRLGFRYLRGMLERYDGDVREALYAYKYGPANLARLRKAGRDPGPYARWVLQFGDTARVIGPGAKPFRRGGG